MHTCCTLFAGVVLSLVVCAPALAGGTILLVPGDHASIQAAVDAAVDGDTIEVAAGTWAESVTITGKGLTLRGAGAAVTTIDGSGVPGASAITCDGGAGTDVLVEGFTVRGGTSTGGIHGVSGSVTVRDAVLCDNASNFGGGFLQDFSCSAQLDDCTIRDNQATNEGGGTYASSFGTSNPLTVERCLYEDNQAGTLGGGFSGYTVATDCVLRGNAADVGGGAYYGADGVIPLLRCTFEGNTATTSAGGVCITTSSGAGATLQDCTFAGNSSGGDAGAASVYAYSDGPFNTTLVRRCAFLGNASGPGEPELRVEATTFATSPKSVDVLKCTFWGDRVEGNGGLALQNDIFWNGASWGTDSGSISVTYTCSPGFTPGIGNISSAPSLVDPDNGDGHLNFDSPCIDAGTGSDPDGTQADMGAFPYDPWTDLAGGVAGNSSPSLLGEGTLRVGDPVTLTLSGGPPFGSVNLILGASELAAPFKGGTLWPALDFIVYGLPTDGDGQLVLGGNWLPGLPAGTAVTFQSWYADGGAPAGFAGSNGVRGTQP